ncbi:hypothetical protein JMJ77_0001711 [Colletotrichum scovillei]|uniref:Uncharacterized protein n=1 Tax=Colletotrichum scovillei TaxID=1209932 RepID=A0A9P7R8Z1_9PEZI|nr:hypothetical protein JMJ77_0001711 [Colletotrichum scovillei]KAG7070119.1 hypothetical protein JMJ76_0001376 [Colletotrichum scovillei]KAG7078368.1 hypothetical protein JMJ78_0002040 [Colletotrichum scovillei]
MDGVHGLSPAWPKLNEMRGGGRRDRWPASSRPAPRERKWIRNDIKVLLWTDQEEGNCAHNDLSTNALSFSLSPTCQLHRWCAHPSPGQVSMPCQLSTSPSRARSGPCLAVKRPGVPRDPFARMPDVHFQGVQTARLVCSSVPSKTPATVRFAGGTVHSGQGATPVPTLSLKTGLARALSTSAMQTDASAMRGTPGYVACRRHDGKTGAWIAMFWDGAKTDSRLTIPAARLRAASPPNMLRERQSTSRAYQTFGSTWKGNNDISSETSDGPERASVGLEKSQTDPEM